MPTTFLPRLRSGWRLWATAVVLAALMILGSAALVVGNYWDEIIPVSNMLVKLVGLALGALAWLALLLLPPTTTRSKAVAVYGLAAATVLGVVIITIMMISGIDKDSTYSYLRFAISMPIVTLVALPALLLPDTHRWVRYGSYIAAIIAGITQITISLTTSADIERALRPFESFFNIESMLLALGIATLATILAAIGYQLAPRLRR